MVGNVVRARSLVAASLIVFAGATLQSCSDSPTTAASREFTTRAPLATLSSAFNDYQFLGEVEDDAGANDVPAQSDLNAFTRADNVSGKIGVKWYWDDINSWTGSGQTGDACALFDTDNDGKANSAVCVRIANPGGDPLVVGQLASGSPINYSCGDSKNERCASPVKSQPLGAIVCEVEKVPGENFFTDGEDGADVMAACSIPLAAIGASNSPNLLNVCSFPSGSPNSNPFDCVVTPGAGFIVIKKETSPDSSGLTFNFKVLPKPVGDSLHSVTDNSSNDEQTSLISAAPGSSYSVSELSLPSGWVLSTAACARQTSPNPTATGTRSGSTISGVSVTSGETTLCTFANQVSAPTISIVKTATPDSIPETGGSVSYSIAVTNTSSIPVTLDSIKDNVFLNLNGQGTCNTGSTLYGTLTPSASYSCSFSKTLAASDAGQTHINQATAYVSSAGGPASASDTARVRYYDVMPNITVTKSADDTLFTATGGTTVAGFGPDQIFTGSGGGGAGTPVFLGQTCDDAGANDQPDQSDLNCFTRADNVADRLWLRWSWDDINSWTGSGQTGDACALLDTDNDTNANYALCVRITNLNSDPNQIGQLNPGSPVLYRCSDNAADKCTSKSFVETLDASSVCTVDHVTEHFTGVGDDGQDVGAECNLRLRDLSPTATSQNVDLLNVCSFPSGSPTSNAFDCVVSSAAGFLVITEVTNPSSAAQFGFQLRNSANTANAFTTSGEDEWAVQAGSSSAALPVAAGTYALTQLRPTSWTLTSIACTRDGSPIGSTSGDTRLNVTIVQGSTTFCTYTNALSASRTVTFTVTVTNNSLEDVTLFSLEDSENPDAGTPTFATLNTVGTCATGGTIVNGVPYTCTFTRTVAGPPGTQHRDQVKAVGKDSEDNSHTHTSSIVTVTIN